MSGVGQSIRRALGLPSAAPQAQRVPFFGTYRTLLQVFGAGIKYRQTMDELRQVAKRKGISAKSPFARAYGSATHKTIPHFDADGKHTHTTSHLLAGSRRARAVGPGSYGEQTPNAKLQLVSYQRHWSLASMADVAHCFARYGK